MKRKSGMYGRLTIVCGSVIETLNGRSGLFILFLKKVSNLGQKVSDVVIFGVIYLRSSVHQCLWLWFLSNWLLLNNAVCTGPSYLLWVDVGSSLT